MRQESTHKLQFNELLTRARVNCVDPKDGSKFSQQRLVNTINSELESTLLQISLLALQNWEGNKARPDVRKRLILYTLIKVLVTYKGISSLEKAQELLIQGGYAPLSADEQVGIFGPIDQNKLSKDEGSNLKNTRASVAASKLKLFICHSHSDKVSVDQIYMRLRDDGFDPWLDNKNLLPGQDWKKEIKKAVQSSDVVMVCLSQSALNREGFFRNEVQYALDAVDEAENNTISLIPVKLENCTVPELVQRWQWVDIFKPQGYELLKEAFEDIAKVQPTRKKKSIKKPWLPWGDHPVIVAITISCTILGLIISMLDIRSPVFGSNTTDTNPEVVTSTVTHIPQSSVSKEPIIDELMMGITNINARVINVAPQNLLVRSEPSKSAPTITSLKEGREVKLLTETAEADGIHWQKIKLPESEGWVSSEYLEIIP